jgi:hypothetical protein
VIYRLQFRAIAIVQAAFFGCAFNFKMFLQEVMIDCLLVATCVMYKPNTIWSFLSAAKANPKSLAAAQRTL